MVTQKLFKRRVRARMARTGESYTTARVHLARTRDRLNGAPPKEPGNEPGLAPDPGLDLAPALELASDRRMTAATGQGWETWLSLLDAWGARDRKRGEVVEFLVSRHAVPSWWAQTLASGYERTRGIRAKHQQADGFTIYASKTVGVPVDVLFDAFADEAVRGRWLVDGSMQARSSQRAKVARFDWEAGPTRVMVTFEAKGPAKATAAVSHERLPGPAEAERAKAAWRERLDVLKAVLESTDV